MSSTLSWVKGHRGCCCSVQLWVLESVSPGQPTDSEIRRVVPPPAYRRLQTSPVWILQISSVFFPWILETRGTDSVQSIWDL